MRLLYGIVGLLLTPFLFFWLRKRAETGKEDKLRFAERFGHAVLPRPEGKLLWLHAASVGETQSVLTLVRALLDRYPDLSMLITTGTVTSATLVAQQKLPRVIHQYVPVDTWTSVSRFLNHWHPDLALWVESELWPQLLWQLQSRRVPALLINARLSARSAKGWQRLRPLIRSLLDCFAGIYAGSKEDAGRLWALGAHHVFVVGNLKYDAAALPVDDKTLSELSAACQGRPVWVAASTHANEEQMMADAHRIIAKTLPQLLTVVVPRHASRGDVLAAELRAQGMNLAQRSKNEPITPQTELYLADTMGELGTFYRLSEVALVGGSLIAHGGHNPLEPARLNCALVTGPNTHNFATIVEHLKRADAIRVVRDSNELAATITTLFTEDAMRLAMAERASGVVEEARGAASHILQHVDQLLNGESA